MTLSEFFHSVIVLLEKKKVQFALAGGFVASIYRDQPRATQDLDFLLLSGENSEKKAQEILSELNLESLTLRKAQLEGGPMFAIKNKSSPVCIVAGRKQNSIGVDFLLPTIPWVSEALERAQHNGVDFGFGKVPCITPEDFILSKLYSYENQKTRFMDLDDLQSVFQKKHSIDFVYLKTRMSKLNLKIPAILSSSVPDELRKLIRK